MSDRPKYALCPTFWGSHGCDLPVNHGGTVHVCDSRSEGGVCSEMTEAKGRKMVRYIDQDAGEWTEWTKLGTGAKPRRRRWFEPNPMPLWLWVMASWAFAWGLGIVIAHGILGHPAPRVTAAFAGAYIALDAATRMWGRKK